jgi:hypothetical protein
VRRGFRAAGGSDSATGRFHGELGSHVAGTAAFAFGLEDPRIDQQALSACGVRQGRRVVYVAGIAMLRQPSVRRCRQCLLRAAMKCEGRRHGLGSGLVR